MSFQIIVALKSLPKTMMGPNSEDPETNDFGFVFDWGESADEELACGIENPESCESCQ